MKVIITFLVYLVFFSSSDLLMSTVGIIYLSELGTTQVRLRVGHGGGEVVSRSKFI